MVVLEDERFMGRAIELARSVPNASPNPRVGAVVVREGRIVGEGVHRGSGHPHAEALALDGSDVEGATLYVNLEPCNHTGRMPPCVPQIVGAGVARVVAAIVDPDARVRGTGFDRLRASGVEVTEGVLAAEARRVNAPYLHYQETGRPHVTLKIALTLDGALAAQDGSSRWITSKPTRRLVHELRRETDAVMVGAGTVLADDPHLTVRDVPSERQPVRIVVDSSGRVQESANVFRGPAPTIVAATDDTARTAVAAWRGAGADVLTLPRGPEGVDLKAMLVALGERRITGILCEGGARLAASLLRDDLVDSLHVHYGPKFVGKGGLQVGDLGVKSMGDALQWQPMETKVSGDDVLVALERRAH